MWGDKLILQSLVKYYEILAGDENSDIPMLGYSRVKVSYALNISKDGELLEVIPLKVPSENGKKMVPQSMVVPEQEKKSVGIKSNFLCGNSSYSLGIDNSGKLERTKSCFEAFKELHNKILAAVNCDEAKAVIKFINSWDVQKALEHPALKDWIEELTAGANMIFRLDGVGYIHQNEMIKKEWEKYKSNSENGNMMQCLDCGQKAKVARLHPNIKGVRGAQSVGASIVSFNAKAYESYGREDDQGLNAPVSEYSTFAYTTVLNSMISDNAHKQYIGDTTIVFWAESKQRVYQDMASLFIDPSEIESEEKMKYVRDKSAIKEIKSIFEKIANGQAIGGYSDYFDNNVKFYILGLSPNAARLSIRFFIVNDFGVFISKITKHYQDLQIEKQFQTETSIFSLWRLLNETVSPKSRDKDASPLLSGAVIRSILTGASYPTALFNSIMVRVRAEHDINYYKAAIIKAYLLRNKNSNKFKEVLTVSLNEHSKNRAYVLGRLFAVLEKAQQDASEGKLNSTIKDRYFTSACATPASVFPILLRLSQHHISKAEYGYTSDNNISQILNMLDIEQNPIPAHLSLDEQGVFVLGYYHQKNALYRKNSEKEN